MARSRRYNRRSSSQRAASLLALALPAPMQRVADTRLGPLLMLLGIPTALVGGLLNINWDNGQPQLSIDPARAAEIRNATQQEWQRLGNSGIGHTATELWNNYANQGSPFGQSTNGYGGVHQNPQVSFPSTSPRTSTYGQTTYPQNQNNSRSANGTYVSAQGYQAPSFQTQSQPSPSDYHRNTVGGTQYNSQYGYPQSGYTQNNGSQYAQPYSQSQQPYTSAQQYPNQNAGQSQYTQYQQPNNYQQSQYQQSGYQQPNYSPYQQPQYQQTNPGQYQQPHDGSHPYQPQSNQQYNQQLYNQQQYNQPAYNSQQYQYPSIDNHSQTQWNNQQTRSNNYPQSYGVNSSTANPNSGWQVSPSQSGYGQMPLYNPTQTASPNLNNHGRY